MNVVTIILARGGSKGVPRKNIKLLGGKPLIDYAIKPSLKSKLVNRTFVSTEDKEIAKIARKYGAEIIDRPMKLALDNTTDLPAFQHAINYIEKELKYFPDIIVHLRCTMPFRTSSDIDKTVKKMISTKADGVRTVHQVTEPPFYMDIIKKKDILTPFMPGSRKKYQRRQDMPKIYRTNGIVDVIKRDIIMKKNKMYAEDENQRAIIIEDEGRWIDIDTKFDFFMCEQIVKGGYLKKWKIN